MEATRKLGARLSEKSTTNELAPPGAVPDPLRASRGDIVRAALGRVDLDNPLVR